MMMGGGGVGLAVAGGFIDVAATATEDGRAFPAGAGVCRSRAFPWRFRPSWAAGPVRGPEDDDRFSARFPSCQMGQPLMALQG